MQQIVTRTTFVAVAALSALCLAGAARAADKAVAPAPAAVAVTTVQDCSVFYDDYHARGFTWGSGPGLGVGFGTFEGALPMYPSNSFPNWYGLCKTWGHYSAPGSVR